MESLREDVSRAFPISCEDLNQIQAQSIHLDNIKIEGLYYHSPMDVPPEPAPFPCYMHYTKPDADLLGRVPLAIPQVAVVAREPDLRFCLAMMASRWWAGGFRVKNRTLIFLARFIFRPHQTSGSIVSPITAPYECPTTPVRVLFLLSRRSKWSGANVK